LGNEKKALITGITGQDGSYLAELLLKKNYDVHGIIRRSSNTNTSRLDHLINKENKLTLHYGDLSQSTNIVRIIREVEPDEIYNLGAQSHVAVSFESPEYTAQTDALGALRILEAVRILGLTKTTRIYQASTSELYGLVQQIPQTEVTPFHPRSPYGVAKLYAYWITINYRESYGMFACNGILFNHESPLRGETFVTKKVVKALCKIKYKKQKKLILGNLNAKRDWGHAEDYVEAMWKMLQQKKPDDFVICTGKQYTIKNFINKVANILKIKITWKGKGIKEKGFDGNGNCIIECNKRYFRPAEVDTLKGNYSKAKRILKWRPKKNLDSLINDMISYELNLLDK